MKLVFKLAAVLAVLFCCVHGFGQAAPISGQAIDQTGAPLPFAQVRVCSATSTGTPCTPTTLIYYDYNLQNVAPNPYTTDQYGNYTVYAPALAAPNLYVVELSPASGITWTYVQNGPYCSLSGCTFTGPITAPYYNATEFPYYEVNGVQIASANLLDSANLARLNVANVFTLNQTAPSFTGHLIGNADTATAFATTPTGCASNLFANSIAANGNLGCAAITGADLPPPSSSTLGGVFASNAPANEFANGLDTSGNLLYAQPTYANLGGTVPTWNQDTTGNAATATALQNVPTNCGSTIPAYGISANGNALCVSSTLSDQYNTVPGCDYPDDGANESCTMSVVLGTAMADTSYTVGCVENTSTSLSTVVLDNISPVTIADTTHYSFSEITQGSSSEWGSNHNYGKTFVCHAHHN